MSALPHSSPRMTYVATAPKSIVHGTLIPQFGKLMLSELNRPLLKQWLAKLGGGPKMLSNKRLTNIQSCLRSALTDAVEDEVLDANPMAGFHYQANEAPSSDDDVDPFTPEEQAAILAQLPAQTRNYFRFAFWTGLRPSEQIALNWSDVDLTRRTVMVRKAITCAAKGIAETPKTRAGYREVKLLDPADEAIRAQREFTWLGLDPHGEVFRNPYTGQRWTSSQGFQKVWPTALRRAGVRYRRLGVRYRRLYQTRHTYASMMLSAGEHPMWVATQMGHRDWAMIIRVYGKWMPSADPNAGGKAVSLFGEMLAKSCHSGAQTTPKQPKAGTSD